MEYDEGYYDEYEDDDFEDEDVDDDATYLEEYLGEFLGGMDKLERRMGRSLTNREIEGIIDQISEQRDTYPDTDKAYKGYYEESGQREYDLGSNQGRREYIAERLDDADREAREQQEEEAEQEEAA